MHRGTPFQRGTEHAESFNPSVLGSPLLCENAWLALSAGLFSCRSAHYMGRQRVADPTGRAMHLLLTMTPPSVRLQWPCLVLRTTVRAPRSPAHGLTTKACRSPPPGLRASSESVVTKYLQVPSRFASAEAPAHDHPLGADDLNSITRTNDMTQKRYYGTTLKKAFH